MTKFATVMMIAGMITGAAAQADGFNCQGRSTGIKIKLYNNTQPEMGSRKVAVMVLSNPEIASPNKTISKFNGANTLSYKGYGKYEAKVDFRFKDTGHPGELIGGTKLGQLKTINLDLNFSYNTLDVELAKVSSVTGVIKYVKRNGDINSESVTCARYLKN